MELNTDKHHCKKKEGNAYKSLFQDNRQSDAKAQRKKLEIEDEENSKQLDSKKQKDTYK